MKTNSLNLLVVALLGVTLCGCASKSSKPAAATPANKMTATPPRDPEIDAYLGAMRADLSKGKVSTINNIMNLTGDEAAVFWPIYSDYESELFELGDQRIALIRRFAAAHLEGKIAVKDAVALGDDYFKLEQLQLDLRKKYYGIISKDLSPIRAAQFAQIEHRIATVIDLAIAAELPLIRNWKAVP